CGSPVMIPSALAILTTSFLLKAPLRVAPYLKSPILSFQESTTSTPVFSISPPFINGGGAPEVPIDGANTNQCLVVFVYQSAVTESLALKTRASTAKPYRSEPSLVTPGFANRVGAAESVGGGLL